MIYTDIIDYNIVGDAKAPLLRCCPIISRYRENDARISFPQFMNYRSFEVLQYKKLMKNTFKSVRIELRNSTGELVPFTAIGITRLTLVFRRVNHL